MCSNICGLRNNFTELKFVVRKNKPNIVFLNETHVTNDCDINDLSIYGYDFINCVSHSKHTGGVCAYINKKLKYFNVSIDNLQTSWFLSFEIIINKSPTILACLYLSSKNEHKSQAIDSLEEWYGRMSPNKDFMLCGDFNIDMLRETTYNRRIKKKFLL